MMGGDTSELEAYNEATHNLYLVPDPQPGEMPRTWKLAILRNVLMDEILKKPRFTYHPYIAMVDLDGVITFDEYVLDMVRKAITEIPDPWGVLTFNSNDYFDWFALRCDLESPKCVDDYGDYTACHTDDSFFPCKPNIYALPFDQTLEVASAFDGLALYKTGLIGDCRFDGRDPNKPETEDCEHVPFHKCLRDHDGPTRIAGLKIPVHWALFYAGKNYHTFEDFRAEVNASQFNSSALLKVNCKIKNGTLSLTDELGLGNLTHELGLIMDLNNETLCA